MTDAISCTTCRNLLPWYVARTLSDEEQASLQAHIQNCSGCQQELAQWKSISQVTQGESQAIHPRLPFDDAWNSLQMRVASYEVTEGALARRSPSRLRLFFAVTGEMVWSQLRLIRRDLWWLPVLLLGFIACFPFYTHNYPDIIGFIGALLMALGAAFIYGKEVDPAREMMLATPTSPHTILTIRLSCVLFYNVLISLAGYGVLLLTHVAISPGWFVSTWLAPLCCLTALSLLISITINAMSAIFVCAVLWLLRALSNPQITSVTFLPQQYESFWHQTPLLFVVAAVALCLTFLLLERKERISL